MRTVLGQLGRTLLTIWLLASLIFLISRLGLSATDAPGLSVTADLSGSYSATPQAQALARQALRQRLGLAKPLFYFSRSSNLTSDYTWHYHGIHNQYHIWLTQLVHGNLGISFRDGQPVAPRLAQALRCTLPLVSTAALLASALALWLAQQLARPSRWRTFIFALLMGLNALPLFALASTLILLLANPDIFDWFPASYQEESFASHSLSSYFFLVLPLASLTISILPGITLQLEAAITRELHLGYATTARAKGASEARVIRHHALRNALLPAIVLFTDLLPAMVAGVVVVEVLFSLPGMGRLLAEAAATRDQPVLLAALLLVAGARLVALLLADALYLWADPRIR